MIRDCENIGEYGGRCSGIRQKSTRKHRDNQGVSSQKEETNMEFKYEIGMILKDTIHEL